MKDEEGGEEKEKEEKEKEKKRKEETEKEKKVKREVGKLGETEEEEKKEKPEEEEEKKSEEKAEEEENKLEEGAGEEEKERKEETEKESAAEKEAELEKEEEAEKKKESEEMEKGKTVEAVSQRSREAMLGRMERELIEEHNKELDKAIKHCKTVIGQNQSLIETLERMKDVNERKLATLKLKEHPILLPQRNQRGSSTLMENIGLMEESHHCIRLQKGQKVLLKLLQLRI
ncbi:hypothetical protein JCGZ_18192 [Jatropha curcas]|uniref:Uncharacterized protein n=1 Tax=Jatropha curcas TaxID=180498 RepID=A0A067KE82_JATCU|nr:hypothetical protein JCGZ_18192 [Jatropha curcas]